MTTPAAGDDEEWTELVSADFPRVDLVSRPANGAKGFLVMKQDATAGVLDPAMIRDLISKTSEEAPVPATETENGRAVLPNGIRLSGSAKDMAAFIHAASIRKRQADDEPDDGDSGRSSVKAIDAYADAVAKADMSAKAQNDLPDSAFAFIESGGEKDAEGKTTPRSLRHFNISDKAHADNAAARIAQGAKFGDEAKPKVEAAQRKFGEKKVSKEAGMPDAVAKDIMDAAGEAVPLDDGMDGMDPTVPMAMPDGEMEVPGDPTDPGSPAWEAIDAATAAKWLSIAARLKNALCILAEREMLEAASADPSDAENAFDLEDAACAVDYVISTLAVFAAGEMSEAEIGSEMAEMCKALAVFDPAPLGVIEGLTAVAKSGRVLSSANEAAIREAAANLNKVLASLPSAPPAAEPVAKEEAAMPINTIDMRGRQLAQGPAADVLARPGPVAKTAMSAEEQARDTGPVNAGGTTGMGQPRMTGPAEALPGDGPQEARPGDAPGRAVVKASRLSVVVYDRQGRQCITRPDAIMQPVAKADGDDAEKPKMQAVFDQDGDLIGVVDPDAITPVAGAAAAPAAGDGDGDADGMQAGPAAAAAPADDMTPQPSADAGVPADAVGKAADENVNAGSPEALDSIIAKAVAAALGAAAPAQEVVAKQAADLAGALARADELEARIAKVEETPAAPKVFTNGQVPPAEQLRGQDQGANAPGQINVAKALERKRELYAAPDAQTQNQIAKSMQGTAIEGLQAIYAAGPTPVRVQHAPAPAPAPAAAQ